MSTEKEREEYAKAARARIDALPKYQRDQLEQSRLRMLARSKEMDDYYERPQ